MSDLAGFEFTKDYLERNFQPMLDRYILTLKFKASAVRTMQMKAYRAALTDIILGIQAEINSLTANKWCAEEQLSFDLKGISND